MKAKKHMTKSLMSKLISFDLNIKDQKTNDPFGNFDDSEAKTKNNKNKFNDDFLDLI